MGLTFKPNIDDLRESPAKFIVEKLIKDYNEESYIVVEPNLESHPDFKIIDFKIAVKEADIVVFLVAHNEFRSFVSDDSKIILDFCGITN